jgi:phage protein D
MELATLSNRYGNFYAPAFAVRMGRNDLTRDLLLAIAQVEVDLVLGAAARFSFNIVNAYSFKDHAFVTGRGTKVLDVLKFGAEVELSLGYGDAKTVPLMASGMITEITTSFPETGAPELSIAGYDHAFPMTVGKSARTWTKALDSDAAHEIASFHNLNAKIETTKERHSQIEQNQESDFEFLKKLADRNHFELYVDETRTLHFAKPNDSAAAVVRLAWGEGLLSFKPEANLAGQIAKVEVYGWDPKKKAKILGVATAGEESGKGSGKSAGELLKSFVKDPSKQPVLRLRQPVFTQAEAEKRANAALNERAKQFLTGEAEAIGLPDLRPDRNVELDNLGVPFSKTYYLQQTTHKIDGSGYRTRFKVKETSL